MREHTKMRFLVAVFSMGSAVACGHLGPSNTASGGAKSAPGAAAAQPIAPTGTSNVVALAKVAGRRVAFIADADAKAVLTVDIATQKQIASTDVGGTPSQVYVTRDGRIFVAVRDTNRLLAFRATTPESSLTRLEETVTPAEPVAFAFTPDESMVVVTTGWGQRLAAFDARTYAARFETRLPREPRGVVVSDDGKQAFVSHAVGSTLTVVALDGTHDAHGLSMRGPNANATNKATQTRQAFLRLGSKDPAVKKGQFEMLATLDKRAAVGRASCQGFTLAKSAAIPNRIFAPQVMVDPGDADQRPSGYGDDEIVPELPAVAVLDEGAGIPLPTSMSIRNDRDERILAAAKNGGPKLATNECLLPRSSAVDPTTQTVLVTCLGIDSVVAYDARAATPGLTTHREWSVGAGPTGIAIDPAAREAIVFSQFDRTVATISLKDLDQLVDEADGPQRIARTALPPLPNAMASELVVGRMLFHSSGDSRISSDGRACASCHPDGRDDAITWATPDGPRRSIMLAGRVSNTPPYSWEGHAKTIDNHLNATFSRLKGEGLRNFEREALVAYITSMPAPPARSVDPHDKATVERGKTLFNSAETECSNCHGGAMLTDGMNHDVGSRRPSDDGSEFNTPSLRLVGGTGPYFHDGRYADFRQLLRQSDGKMGHTKQLSNADLDALATYLETL